MAARYGTQVTEPLSVFHAAQEAPDAVAWVLGSELVSYAALAERVVPVVETLRARGCPFQAPLSLVGASDPETLATLYACLELAQPVALIHPRLTAEERARVERVVEANPFEGGPAAPESCLAVLFTSGTTGAPKGVELSRRAFLASAQASGKNLPIGPGDRWLLGLPIAHVGGLSVLTRSLVARAAVVIPEEIAGGARLPAAALRHSLERDAVTIASLVPTQLSWLLTDSDFRPPPTLRAVLLGGAAARPDLLARAADRGIPVLTTYGCTEACSQVTTQAYDTVNRGELGVGAAMQGTEVRLVDGAVWVRGPTLLTRYLTDRGPASALACDGFFHTDDFGRFDAAGRLHILGRRSDKIVTGGENVFPAEVETVLERCPGVEQACVFGIDDATWGELVATAVVPAPSGGPSLDALRRFVNEHLAAHKRPRRVAFVPRLEVAESGKLDRRATRLRAEAALEAF
jgi:O-succinylbenzoic acid--CoA ligase